MTWNPAPRDTSSVILRRFYAPILRLVEIKTYDFDISKPRKTF